MKPIEQNISEVKLERMRLHLQALYKKRFLPPMVVLLLSLVLILIVDGPSIVFLLEGKLTDSAMWGAILILVGHLMLALMFSIVSFLIFLKCSWERRYHEYNFSMKSRYLVQILEGLPGFSKLSYSSIGVQYSYQELSQLHLVPMGRNSLYQCTDKLDGCYDNTVLRAGTVVTANPPPVGSKQSLPDELFRGQVLSFTTPEGWSLTPSRVQVLSRSWSSMMKKERLPCQIAMGQEDFDGAFLVYGDNEYTACSVLSIQVQSRILELARETDGKLSLLFDGGTLHVAVQQHHTTFNASINLSLPEQRKQLIADSELIRRARQILVTVQSDL